MFQPQMPLARPLNGLGKALFGDLMALGKRMGATVTHLPPDAISRRTHIGYVRASTRAASHGLRGPGLHQRPRMGAGARVTPNTGVGGVKSLGPTIVTNSGPLRGLGCEGAL
jgi:hypothetical protein